MMIDNPKVRSGIQKMLIISHPLNVVQGYFDSEISRIMSSHTAAYVKREAITTPFRDVRLVDIFFWGGGGLAFVSEHKQPLTLIWNLNNYSIILNMVSDGFINLKIRISQSLCWIRWERQNYC